MLDEGGPCSGDWGPSRRGTETQTCRGRLRAEAEMRKLPRQAKGTKDCGPGPRAALPHPRMAERQCGPGHTWGQDVQPPELRVDTSLPF